MNGLTERFDIYDDGSNGILVCDAPSNYDLQNLRPETFYEIDFFHPRGNDRHRLYIESFEKIGNKLFISCNMRAFGMFTLLRQVIASPIERPWLNMIGKRKKLYTATCLFYSGIPKRVAKKSVTIEGKYITDYYSFFCEIGYGFAGRLGYMGRCLDGLVDCFCECEGYSEVSLTWHDFETAKYSIENNYPYQTDRHEIVDKIVDALSSHMTLILK
ncbi:barstar family protein [Bartonella sp. HY038]|uniref:barstar family protein n=1 Tax=Bartonella sp. HY038 TaxID=2759660 RepID=UPI0015F8BE4D|nr:barstar family protein [Bartonella sp. HY038]